MLSELYKATTAVVSDLLLSEPTLILLPQTTVITVSFDLLSANSKLGSRGGDCNS